MGAFLDRAAVPASVSVGVLATLTMDAVFVAASRVGGKAFTSDKIGLELVGRWASGLARGRLRHSGIASEPARRGETLAGLAVHYGTGVALTRCYYAMLPGGASGSSLPKASTFGAATALLPLLVMYPSWGLGPFALRTGETSRLVRIMLLGHTAFGAGIGLWTAVLVHQTNGKNEARTLRL